MYCYYCGKKVNEKKQPQIVSNKLLFDMEIRNLTYNLVKEKEALKNIKRDFKNEFKMNKEDPKKLEELKNKELDAINKQNAVITKAKEDLAKKKSSASSLENSKYYVDKTKVDAESTYICPRCGHIVHSGHEEKDIKSLSAACHAELQRGRNDFARGMSCLSIAVILAITGFIFLLLARKSDIQYQISTTCPEFWVFLILSIISVILIVSGAVLVIKGVNRKSNYTKLLKDINRKTFIQ